MTDIKKSCLDCGQVFVTTKTGMFCSDLCGVRFRRKRARNKRIISMAIIALRDEIEAHRKGLALANVYDVIVLNETSHTLLASVDKRAESKRKAR